MSPQTSLTRHSSKRAVRSVKNRSDTSLDSPVIFSMAGGSAPALLLRNRAKVNSAYQQAMLEALLESSEEPIFAVNRDYRYIRFNSQHATMMRALFGADIEIGHNLLDYYSNRDDCKKAKKNIDRAFGGESVTVVSTFGGQSRHRRFFELSHRPIRDPKGDVAGVAVFARDLTERKKTEEKIKRNEARLKSLLKTSRRMEEALLSERNFSDAVIQTTGGLIIGLDQEGRIQLFNRACERISGYTFEEVAGKPFGDLFLPPEEAETVKSLFKSIARGEAPSESENENFFIAKDGSRRFISWKNTVIKDGNGTVELIICAGIDITEHNMMEELVRLRAAELTEANRELDAFSYSVSHDLKAPLQVMRGFGDLLLKNHADRLDGQGREFLQLLHDEVERMDKLINDMLHLSRITRQEMQRTEVDLSECARAVIRDLQSAQPGRSIETVIQHAMRCRADERLISIVLQNLLGNSWKFTKNQKHARIEFGKTVDAGRHVYFVRDNGAGFSMKNADRLFTLFQRLHSPAQFEGTGIGLAIVKRVVQRHGGKVWAEGQEDKGASFYFTLG